MKLLSIRWSVWCLVALLCLHLQSCNSLEKDIELNLPEQASLPVIEAYFEPGAPYRLALSESVGYFDALVNPVLTNALVLVKTPKGTDTLFFNPLRDSITNKTYNFNSRKLVPTEVGTPIYVEVRDHLGRKCSAQTQVIEAPIVDSVKITYNEQGKAYFQIRIVDNPSTQDYYRVVFSVDSLDGDPSPSLSLNDRFADRNIINAFTGFRYEKGDTVYVSIFKQTEDAFQYFRTARMAVNNNGNPFAQGGKVLSNVQGAFGLVTVMPKWRRRYVLE
jgi:hypothetical protein